MGTTKKIVTIIVGTIILFAWGILSWVILPFHANALNNIPEGAIDTKQLQDLLPHDGVYHYPGLPDNNKPEKWKELERKLSNGPRITLMVYKKGSTEYFDTKSFLLNLLYNFLTVVLLLVITSKVTRKSISNILLISLLIGLLIGFAVDMPEMNWYLFPMGYTLVTIFDHIFSMLLLGLFFGLYTFKQE